jgi:hypothetical protein
VANKYLHLIPKPLLDDLVKGRWLPVVGAGMSLNATLPPGMRMPLWGDLGKALADELTDYSPSGVLDGISAYEHEFGRARLIERLVEVLHLKDAHPGNAHREFCALPFDIVCTTNFDFLLERQYDLIPRQVHPVVDEDQLSINIGNAGTLLLKLHGDLRHPRRLVVTESDYDGFLSSYPLIATYLSNQLITKTAVFIGYSLDDPDFRQIWNVVSARLGKTRRMAYAMVVNARPGDIARFERRGVKVVNLPGPKDKYGEVLAEAFRELGEYLRDNIVSAGKVTEEEPLRELLLPRDSSTRLCFFSVPLDDLPFYRQRVFPVVVREGFVPVTAADFITPGDSVSAKIDTLIDRSFVMVIELNARWTRAELAMAIARTTESDNKRSHRRRLHIILVGSGRESIPPSAAEFPFVQRPESLSTADDGFVDQLGQLLANYFQETGTERASEPQRLLKAKEYRAAVIAAMTQFEATLRQRLDKPTWNVVSKPMSVRSLVARAIESQVLPASGREEIDYWSRIRNEAVHTARPVTRQEAKMIVDGVEHLLGLPY